MNRYLIATAGSSPALSTAKTLLQRGGYAFTGHPQPEVTHLLLPVPSLSPDGTVLGGEPLGQILPMLPENITVIGGNLPADCKKIDLLQDAEYLAKNAAITARCALRLGAQHLSCTLEGCNVLVIGWGRIGQCLAALLKSLGASVTVAARKAQDRAMACALGHAAQPLEQLPAVLPHCRLLYNTVPAPILPPELAALCPPDCVKIELASLPGIAGEDVISGRGLPGKMAPESSGKLIAETVMRLLKQQEGTQ